MRTGPSSCQRCQLIASCGRSLLCSMEWCPVASDHNILVCGTYQLQKGTGEEDAAPSRTGRLYLFEFRREGPMTPPLTELQRMDTAAILDLKWCHVAVSERPLLGLAAASGDLQLYALTEAQVRTVASEQQDQSTCYMVFVSLVGRRRKLQSLSRAEVGADRLVLSLDWSTGRLDSSDIRVVCSDSAGCISVVSLGEGAVTVQSQWKAHDFEAWISAFSYWDTQLIYTGIFDHVFKVKPGGEGRWRRGWGTQWGRGEVGPGGGRGGSAGAQEARPRGGGGGRTPPRGGGRAARRVRG
uniref:Uncharacterized protein n=1 Tax=Knipowitschia caucasica TaxID=637954 RepID=A0AAV2MU27_KNICA